MKLYKSGNIVIMKIKWLIILLVAGNCTVLAQPAFADMICLMEDAYKNRDTYSYEVIYEYYEENQSKPSDILKGVIYKKGNNYFSRIGPTDFVYLDGAFLKINHNEKAMLYSEYHSEIPVSPVQISSMTKYFDDIKVTQKEGLIYYDIAFITSPLIPYYRMLLVVSDSKMEIVRQELFIRPGAVIPGSYGTESSAASSRVVIRLNVATASGLEKKLVFNHYIQSLSDLSPSPSYPGYEIYQQTP